MAAAIVVVVGTFLALAFREVQSTLLLAATARAHGAADQIASLLTQSTQQRLIELRTVADDGTVRAYLTSPTDELKPAAQARLATLSSPNPQVVELWDGAGRRVLSLATPATATNLLPAEPSAPTSTGVGRLQLYHGSLVTEAVAEVTTVTPGDAHASRLGFLVVRRPAVITATADSLNRLVGGGASVKIGNRVGGGWTDLSKVIEPPPIERVQSGVAIYRTREGDDHLGTYAAIGGTPWAVWVDFSLPAILAPARAFMRRMIAIGLALVLIASLLVRAMTARITTPLSELARASDAMAGGEYSHRVAVARSDEIGTLATAFNAMSERVEQAQRELEERVQQRTAKLAESREELDLFFALTPDMLCIADMEGRLKRVNTAWHAALGWSDAELTRTPYLEFVHPDDRTATEAESASLIAGGRTLTFENRFRCKDGSYKWLSWRAAPLVSRGVIYAAARDVTEQKRTTRELDERATELAEVNRELEAFSYSVSHDLRAPLRHVSGFAALLTERASGSLDAEATRLLKTIVNAAGRMGCLIDDLLGFSRVGRTPLSRTDVNLDRLLQEARDEVAMGTNGQAIVWRVGRLPTVSADPALLRLVFVNLLSNAAKYSASRSPAEIEVGAIPTDTQEAVLFVRDNGVGFDAQYSHKLFGVFQRLHSAEEFEGTGIGLANVKRIVHRHGGRVWAESAIDRGATFYVALPKATSA
jgi:PAS domain S-box-containing protein